MWEYINPVNDTGTIMQGTIAEENNVFRCVRYVPEYSGLVGKDLTPSGPIELYLTSANNEPILPKTISLEQNLPNPFNLSTSIKFSIPEAMDVNLAVYDLLGRQVEVLIQEKMSAGTHHVIFNAKDLSSGIFFVRLTAGELTILRRMVLMK